MYKIFATVLFTTALVIAIAILQVNGGYLWLALLAGASFGLGVIIGIQMMLPDDEHEQPYKRRTPTI